MALTPEIKNRKAAFEYAFIQNYTAGIVLTGTEIKSVRLGKVNIAEAYAVFVKDELFIRNMDIALYEQGSYNNHEPRGDRKLLLQRKELKKLQSKLKDKGLTIVPIKLFFNEKGYAKIDIALAKGKKLYDKREDVKKRDITREMAREQ